jgi:hypothetical protein
MDSRIVVICSMLPEDACLKKFSHQKCHTFIQQRCSPIADSLNKENILILTVDSNGSKKNILLNIQRLPIDTCYEFVWVSQGVLLLQNDEIRSIHFIPSFDLSESDERRWSLDLRSVSLYVSPTFEQSTNNPPSSFEQCSERLEHQQRESYNFVPCAC